jgi:hypothetical protein
MSPLFGQIVLSSMTSKPDSAAAPCPSESCPPGCGRRGDFDDLLLGISIQSSIEQVGEDKVVRRETKPRLNRKQLEADSGSDPPGGNE